MPRNIPTFSFPKTFKIYILELEFFGMEIYHLATLLWITDTYEILASCECTRIKSSSSSSCMDAQCGYRLIHNRCAPHHGSWVEEGELLLVCYFIFQINCNELTFRRNGAIHCQLFNHPPMASSRSPRPGNAVMIFKIFSPKIYIYLYIQYI
jgi:hypothetical protein